MFLALLLALQQEPVLLQGRAPVQATTPPSRDTTGYWQQRADYRITARLDERAQRLEARGTLHYVNNSPDTLRELYLHQYLNAFRPGSRWSADDAREGRVRFQDLQDPAYGYERFTADPVVGGVAVRPEYPGAPDSTVVRLPLPRPLAPGDSVRVEMAWTARPSMPPRRQGRRGRHWDFAHWYPKVAVYDRGGWEFNTLVPAGEFYGEFGDFEVRLVLRDDQVLGTTGVVVEGDPGWERARRWGTVVRKADAYASRPLPAVAGDPAVDVAPGEGEKLVRVVARDVHTFGWSVSPDYRYEGAAYVRPPSLARPTRFATWDTVAIHVLYQPGDEATWGNGQVVRRTANTLAWLERIYGPYAYPQMTVLHRIEGGGTEFPMMQMNGSPSQGLNLHEGGHIYSYGILASNEWRSGWMDEGLTSYQTAWAQGLTRIDRARGDTAGVPLAVPLAVPLVPPRAPAGYAGRAERPNEGPDAPSMAQWRLAATGVAQPIGLAATAFRDFGTYNSMIYSRAEMMYGALRDAIGDSAFTAFLQDYYARWALRHVDEVAMRASAERAAGRDLSWFFDQWVHDVGLLDYALTGRRTRREGDGWVTRATIRRVGEYRHPMPVGVRTAAGWTVVRGDPMADRQTLEIRTAQEPLEVRLDPFRTTEDWYRPNDERRGWWIFGGPREPKNVVDWPLLDQASADRVVTAWSPLAWPGGVTGDWAVGLRTRSSYRGLVDRNESGIAYYVDDTPPLGRCRYFGLVCDAKDGARWQSYTIVENPRFGRGIATGFRMALAELEGVQFAELRQRWDRSRFAFAPSGRHVTDLSVRFTRPFAPQFLDYRWSGVDVLDATGAYQWTEAAGAGEWRSGARAEFTGGITGRSPISPGLAGETFAVAQLELSALRGTTSSRTTTFARLWGTYGTDRMPRERLPAIGAPSATALFFNHWLRPANGLLTGADVPFVVAGGAAMRGYVAALPVARAAALNLEQAVRLRGFRQGGRLGLFATAFGDALAPLERFDPDAVIGDAGVGLALRGPLFDRDVRFRVDLPLWLSDPVLAAGRLSREERLGLRVSVAATELW